VPPVAVAVTRRELRMATFRRASAGLQPLAWATVPLPEGIFGTAALGGPVGEAAALEAAAKTLVDRIGGRHPHASLVLPDAWVRGMTVELGELPEDAATRLEVLRFRLRKMVPFRIEELRLAAAPIERLTGQEEPLRVLALLASEGVCAALERAFAAAGVRVGQIVGATLARLDALASGGRLPGLAAVASVEPEGFTLVFARDGAPVAWRQKSFTEGLSDQDRERLLAAELRLTRTFLAERLAGERLSAALLAAPAAVAPFWTRVLEEGLGSPVAALAVEHLPLAAAAPATAEEVAPLAGAACREVAA
jgi:type IV pilus assembly protein PilM